MRIEPKVTMIASGKGGTGKSTVSVLLGSRLAARGKKVLLIELDSGLRSVDIIAGVYGKTVYDIEDVLSGRCEGGKAVVESPIYPGLSVISAPYEGGAVRGDALEVLTKRMTDYFDEIILDTAAGMGEAFQAAARVSDRALLVLTPDPVALRDGRIAADALLDGGMRTVRLVINRVRADSFHTSGVRDLDECIDTVAVQLIAVLPESAEVQRAAAQGQPLAAGCMAYRAVDALAARKPGRVCTTVQLSDTGIAPGSGVGNHRAALTRESLGVPVYALGVPTVVDAWTLAADLLESAGVPDWQGLLKEKQRGMTVTPRDIDRQVRELGRVLGYALTWALQDLDLDAITSLLG